jgi:hypothetical protein
MPGEKMYQYPVHFGCHSRFLPEAGHVPGEPQATGCTRRDIAGFAGNAVQFFSPDQLCQLLGFTVGPLIQPQSAGAQGLVGGIKLREGLALVGNGDCAHARHVNFPGELLE